MDELFIMSKNTHIPCKFCNLDDMNEEPFCSLDAVNEGPLEYFSILLTIRLILVECVFRVSKDSVEGKFPQLTNTNFCKTSPTSPQSSQVTELF